jgi:hypothetical protein
MPAPHITLYPRMLGTKGGGGATLACGLGAGEPIRTSREKALHSVYFVD